MRAGVRFGGLRTRLVLPVVLAAVPATWLVIQTSDAWRRHEVSDALSAGIQLTRHAAAVHARTLRHAHRTLATIASASETIDAQALERVLHAAVQGGALFDNAGVLDADGQIVCAYRPMDASTGQRLRAVLAQSGANAGVGEYDVDPGSGQVSVLLAEPVLSTTGGRMRRFVFGVVELSWLDDTIGRATLPAGTVVTVFDRNARVLAREPKPTSGVENHGPAAAVIRAALTNAGEGTAEATDSVSRVYAYAPLSGPTPPENLYMSVGISKAVATAQADRILKQTGVALLLACAFAGAVAWVSSGRLSREVEALVATTTRLTDGDMTARTGVVEATPELARLGTGLDKLAVVLADREREILRRHDELTHHERRLRAVIETGLDRVVLFDADGTVLYASPSSVQMNGYQVDEVIGRQTFEFVHPDDREPLRAQFAEVARTPAAIFRATFRLKTKFGTWRWIETEISNMLHEPRVRAIVGKYRDVTESRHAEEQRRRLHEALETRVHERTADLVAANQTLQKLSSALEQTADSVFITNCDGVIEYVNPAFETMTGYTRDEALGQTPRLFASKLHDRKFYETLWTTIQSGQVFRAIVTNRTKDGRLFNEDQTITPVRDANGTITHFVSTGRDITQRRRTEQALRRLNSEFENEAGRIAALLHDEAGQFLTAAHITLADVARDLPSEMRDRIQQVRRHLDQAEEHLRRVSHELHPRMLDDLGLTEAVRFLSNAFGRRTGIAIDVDVALDSPCPRAVETVFYRLVQEALTNIGKHAKAARVSIRLGRDERMLFCSIRDDGVGFDVDAVEERSGFSLGLTLIKDRLEAVGGTLTVVSAPHKGTQLGARAPLEA